MCFVFCPLLFPSKRFKIRTLSSEYKLTKLILWVGCPSYNLTLYSKPALIHKVSTKIPKAFSKLDISGKTK